MQAKFSQQAEISFPVPIHVDNNWILFISLEIMFYD